jgi:hypothetical protein
MKVRIANPTPGGARFTSAARAEQFVRKGRARWKGDRLEFLPQHHTRVSMELTAQELEDQRYRLSSHGYDSRGLLREEEIRRIPVVAAIWKLFTIQSRRGPGLVEPA